MVANGTSSLQNNGKMAIGRRIFWEEAISYVIVPPIGAIIPAIFWVIWYAIVGSIPRFMGHSRLWLDTISGAFYAIIIAVYIAEVASDYDDLTGQDKNDGCEKYSISFREFVTECRLLSLIGLALIISLIAGGIFSFAAGLVGFSALGIIIGMIFLVWKVVGWLIEYVVIWFLSMIGLEFDDEPFTKK